MSATDELRRLLDERGVKYETDDAQVSDTEWYYVTKLRDEYHDRWIYEEPPDCDLLVSYQYDLGAEDAIAATLGHYNAVRYVGLRHGEYWERTENGDYYCGGCGWKVTDHDSYCPECGGALHNATLGSFNCTNGCTNSERTETCHDKNGFDSMFGFECTVCGAMTDGYMLATEDMGHYKQFNFCPNCGRKVVGE